jgi:DNA-binding beta-propeller fold protein YncE
MNIARLAWVTYQGHIAVNPNTNMIYSAQRDHTVSVINGSTDEVMKNIYLPHNSSDNT